MDTPQVSWKMPVLPWALLVGLAISVIAGCGPGSGQPPGAPPPPPPPPPVVLMPNTKVVDEASRASLEAFDPSTGQLSFAQLSPIVARLSPGDVLASEPSKAAPHGFLRKVVSVKTQGANTIVESVPARLDEAIKSGALKTTITLTPAQIRTTLRRGVLEQNVRSNDLGGSASGERSFHDEISWHQAGDGWDVGVDGSADYSFDWKVGVSVNHPACDFNGDPCYEFYGYAEMSDTAKVHLSGSITKSFDEDVTVVEHTFDPVTVFIGPVPLVFVPKASVHLQVGGTGTASLDYTATVHGPHFQLGAHWDSVHDWTPYNDFDGITFEPGPVDLHAAVDVHARVPIIGQMLLYDGLGPTVTLTAEGDGHFRIPSKPRWSIHGHVHGDVAVTFELFDKMNVYNKNLFDYDGTIAESTNNPPRVSVALPGANSTAGIAGPDFGIVHFVANTDDDEDGPGCCNVAWILDGRLLGTGRSISHVFTTADEGSHSVVATAFDSDGASTDTAPVSFTIGDAPPGARILLPASGCADQVYTGTLVELQGANERPFLSQLPFRCDWFSDNPADTQFPLSIATSVLEGCDPTASNCCKISTRFPSAGPRNLTLLVTQPGNPDQVSVTSKFVQVFDKPLGPLPVLEMPGPTACSSNLVGANFETVDFFAEIHGGTRPLRTTWTWLPPGCDAAQIPVQVTPPDLCTNLGCASKFSVRGADLSTATPPQCAGAPGTLTMSTTDAAGLAHSQSVFIRLIDDRF
jgi:hypothetical protein